MVVYNISLRLVICTYVLTLYRLRNILIRINMFYEGICSGMQIWVQCHNENYCLTYESHDVEVSVTEMC